MTEAKRNAGSKTRILLKIGHEHNHCYGETICIFLRDKYKLLKAAMFLLSVHFVLEIQSELRGRLYFHCPKQLLVEAIFLLPPH